MTLEALFPRLACLLDELFPLLALLPEPLRIPAEDAAETLRQVAVDVGVLLDVGEGD